jgi:hypothetical protein
LSVGFLFLLPMMTVFDGLFVAGTGLTRLDTPAWIQFIKANAGEHDKVAVVDAGQIGYETDLRILDMVGLLDAYVARLNPALPQNPFNPAFGYGYGKWDVDYVLAEDPAFVQAHLDRPHFRATGRYRSDWLGTDALLNDPRFQARYTLVEWETDSLFVRRDWLASHTPLPAARP